LKALVCSRYGGPEELEVRDVLVPACGEDDLLVRVRAAGLNFADLLVLRGEYQSRVAPPFVPGAEVFGEVVQAGAEVRGFASGDLVLGQVLTGAYAEQALMDPSRTVRLDAEMPNEHAGAFFINYGTAYSALVQRARAQPGESLLVLGAAGGVGLAAVQIGRALGLAVVADCRGNAKQALVAAQGAVAAVDHGAPDFRDRMLEITAGRGVDIVLDMIGGAATTASLRCVAWRGRIVVIGFASGSHALLPTNHLLVKNCSVIGHWWGDYHWRDRAQLDEAFAQLFAWYRQGLLRPCVQQTVDMAEVPAALQRFAQRNLLGKIVMLASTAEPFGNGSSNDY